MNVRYLKLSPNKWERTAERRAPGNRDFDVTFSDPEGESGELRECIKQLKSGDTLHVKKESFLAQDPAECVALLGQLALRGVNVYLERADRLIRSEDSPFRDMSKELIGALHGFRNAFTKLRQKQGYDKAKAEGRKVETKKKKALPRNFRAMKEKWERKELTVVEAAKRCGMPVSTFWTKCQQGQGD